MKRLDLAWLATQKIVPISFPNYVTLNRIRFTKQLLVILAFLRLRFISLPVQYSSQEILRSTFDNKTKCQPILFKYKSTVICTTYIKQVHMLSNWSFNNLNLAYQPITFKTFFIADAIDVFST